MRPLTPLFKSQDTGRITCIRGTLPAVPESVLRMLRSGVDQFTAPASTAAADFLEADFSALYDALVDLR